MVRIVGNFQELPEYFKKKKEVEGKTTKSTKQYDNGVKPLGNKKVILEITTVITENYRRITAFQ